MEQKSYKQQPFSAWSAPSAAGISARLKRLARTPAPLTALTAPEGRPSTHSSVLVHVEKKAARRNRRIEGDLDPPFLRSRELAASDGDTDGIWCAAEAAATLAGSNILGYVGVGKDRVDRIRELTRCRPVFQRRRLLAACKKVRYQTTQPAMLRLSYTQTCWDSYVHHAAYRPWHGPSDAHSSVERDCESLFTLSSCMRVRTFYVCERTDSVSVISRRCVPPASTVRTE